MNATGPQKVDVSVELFADRLQVWRPQQIRLSTTRAVLYQTTTYYLTCSQ